MSWPMLPRTLATAALLGLAGCTTPVTPHAVASPTAMATIAVVVGPCFGFCPVYSVAVTPEGTVTFEGKRHTAVLGKRLREGEPASYRALAAALAPYRPTTGTVAETPCDQKVSDQPRYHITWTTPEGTVTTLDHDKGCRSAASQSLNAALEALPEQLGVEPWAHQFTRPGASRG